MSSRRDTLWRLASVGVVSTSGCLSLFKRGNVDLYIVNWCQDTADVEIVISSAADSTVFNKKYEVAPNEDVKRENIVGGGQYQIRAILNNEWEFDYNFTMKDCKNQKLLVRVNRCDSIELEERDC